LECFFRGKEKPFNSKNAKQCAVLIIVLVNVFLYFNVPAGCRVEKRQFLKAEGFCGFWFNFF